MSQFILETDRVGLRKFLESDLQAFASINGDPDVMEFFPSTMSADESEAMAQRINSGIDECGFGFWAAEEKSTCKFIGFTGLQKVKFEGGFTPAVEIGWRLAKEFWGRGLATESAQRCLEFAFFDLQLESVVSFTSILNGRSYRVMERIGMKRITEFNHPAIPNKHRLNPHILYQLHQRTFLQLA